jgi:peptidyl-prolyl cis-trans isomerase C
MANLNLTENDLKSQIRKGLAIQHLVSEHYAQKVEVTDRETKEYFDKHPELFRRPENVRASHILIAVDPQGDEASKAGARKKAEEIQAMLKQGKDFAALAGEFSDCPSSSQGGDLGYFTRGKMVGSFEDTAFSLKPGEMSGIVETKFGYHLIKVAEKNPETTVSYEDIEDKIAQQLKLQKVRGLVADHVSEVKGKARVERFLVDPQ